jgi:hypothetical protein
LTTNTGTADIKLPSTSGLEHLGQQTRVSTIISKRKPQLTFIEAKERTFKVGLKHSLCQKQPDQTRVQYMERLSFMALALGHIRLSFSYPSILPLSSRHNFATTHARTATNTSTPISTRQRRNIDENNDTTATNPTPSSPREPDQDSRWRQPLPN